LVVEHASVLEIRLDEETLLETLLGLDHVPLMLVVIEAERVEDPGVALVQLQGREPLHRCLLRLHTEHVPVLVLDCPDSHQGLLVLGVDGDRFLEEGKDPLDDLLSLFWVLRNIIDDGESEPCFLRLEPVCLGLALLASLEFVQVFPCRGRPLPLHLVAVH